MFWTRVKEHKVIQWGIAYLGAALALAHGAELVSHALAWPDVVWRTFVLALIVGFPVALTIAWYHGHKGLQQIGAGELAIVAMLLLIGAVFFTVALRPSAEHAAAVDVGAVATDNRSAVGGTVPPDDPAEPTRPSASPGRAVQPDSVGVLPLENLSPDPANAFYANGLHAEIIGQLTKLRNLTVINRESMLRYAENRPPLQEIAQALGVESLLTGRFQFVEGRIRVGVELVDPSSGANLWNETYEREYAEIFSVQADIAMNVANALNAEFSEEEQQRIEREPTSSPVAYGLYLQARSLQGVGEQAPRMHELLDQALAIDPDFALAYGWKAVMYAQELINTSEGPARSQAELEPLIRENAEKALALDAEVSPALGALGNLASYSWRWAEAKQAYDRQLETRNFNGAPGAWFRAWYGDPQESARIAEQWTEVSPLEWAGHWTHGIALQYAGDYEGAAAKLRDGVALAPTLSLQHAWLAHNAVALGNPEGARTELVLVEQLLGENRSVISLVDAAYDYGRIGDHENARRLFDEISAVAETGTDIGAGGWALLHLAVGETDEALEWLERGAEKARRHELDPGYYSLMNIRMNFTGDPVLERPDFVDVRNRLRGE